MTYARENNDLIILLTISDNFINYIIINLFLKLVNFYRLEEPESPVWPKF